MSRSRRILLTAAVVLAAPAASAAAAEPPEILVSRQLLESRSLSVGDVVRLSSDPEGDGARPFRIAGVYEPTPDPMKLTSRHWAVRMHLPDLMELNAPPGDPFAAETVSRINVALRDPGDAATFIGDLQARLPGLVATSTTPDAAVFVVLERFHLAIALVTVLGSTAFLLALMVMRADERREIVGILRLVGLSKSRILLAVLVEGTCIALAGAAFGILFAAVMQDAFNAFFQWHYDTSLTFIRLTPGIAVRCVVLAVPLGVLAGLVASWTLLRREIVALLRR